MRKYTVVITILRFINSINLMMRQQQNTMWVKQNDLAGNVIPVIIWNMRQA